jgi:hypothetical protein
MSEDDVQDVESGTLELQEGSTTSDLHLVDSGSPAPSGQGNGPAQVADSEPKSADAVVAEIFERAGLDPDAQLVSESVRQALADEGAHATALDQALVSVASRLRSSLDARSSQ